MTFLKESIFKAYDVRGAYPDELDDEAAYLIGRSFATIFGDRKILVGGDSRLSTPSLKERLIDGLLESGAHVTDAGMTATPVVYYGCYGLGYGAGVMVTGSHLEADQNGMKFCGSTGIPIGYDTGLSEVKRIAESKSFRAKRGTLERRDIADQYSDFVADVASVRFEDMKAVVDGSNGSAGMIYAEILGKIGVDVVKLYCEPDGRFPNHTPDPMKGEFMVDLSRTVQSSEADVGFGFDGDGDRLAVVDERGGVANPNHVFSLMIEEVLRGQGGGKIVHDVLCSKLIEDVTVANGGVPVACRVGHTFIAAKCAEVDALMGGEVSGHYFFKEASYADDVMVACVKLLTALRSRGSPISSLINYPAYFDGRERVPVAKGMKFRFIAELEARLRRQDADLIALDGVKVNFERGWALFRPSNTEDVISMGYESSDREEFERIRRFVEDVKREIPR